MPASKPSPQQQQRFQRALADLQGGRIAQARAALAALDAEVPGDFLIKAYLADCLAREGKLHDAQARIREACDIDPRQIEAWKLAMRIAMALNQEDEVEQAGRRALALDPSNVDSLRALAFVLHHRLKFVEAAQLARQALAFAPDDSDLSLKLGAALMNLGRVAEAAKVYEAALPKHPDHPDFAEGYASCLNYLDGADPARVFAAHQRFGQIAQRLAGPAARRPETHAPSPDRPLRVGFISPDLRRHSVTYFLRALFEKHDERAIQIFAYATLELEDETTELLRSALPPNRWRRLSPREPQAALDKLRDDRLDILIDLSGLTRGHSMALFAQRPAPLQVTWAGYPHTTGMETIDARIVDSLTDPLGAETFAVEQLIRLDPCFLCYTPPDNLPLVSSLPSASSGSMPQSLDASMPPPITFGSFNALSKLNDSTLQLWSRVLAAVPHSRLLIKAKGLENESVRADFTSRLAAASIPLDRTDVLGIIAAQNDHLSAYSRVDLALDTFPYHGTTTTCEALLMGVPVISLSPPDSRAHASRVGRSLLTAAGLPEFIADSEARFIEVAREWSSNSARLATLRANLRGQLLASPLCDAAAFARRFEHALRQLWRDHLSASTKP